MKLLQYENGTTEIRTYSECVGRKPCALPEDLLAIMSQVARVRNQLKAHSVYNPFYEEEMGLYDLDEMELATKRKAHSERNSLSRTVQNIYSISRQCKWEWFITLTYRTDVVDRYSYAETMKKARKWFNNQKNRYAPDLQYLFVGEGHKNGAYHIHGLVAQCGAMSFVDSGHFQKGLKVFNVGGWKFGFSTATEVRDIAKVSSYITKYITKSLVADTEGMRRYYKSNNIPEVQSTEFFVEGNEKVAFAEMLADSLGVVKEYEKEIGGYTAVKYQYFKSEVEENGR